MNALYRMDKHIARWGRYPCVLLAQAIHPRVPRARPFPPAAAVTSRRGEGRSEAESSEAPAATGHSAITSGLPLTGGCIPGDVQTGRTSAADTVDAYPPRRGGRGGTVYTLSHLPRLTRTVYCKSPLRGASRHSSRCSQTLESDMEDTPLDGQSRFAREGETCPCGLPAVLVFFTERFGEVPWCGQEDIIGGRQLVELEEL